MASGGAGTALNPPIAASASLNVPAAAADGVVKSTRVRSLELDWVFHVPVSVTVAGLVDSAAATAAKAAALVDAYTIVRDWTPEQAAARLKELQDADVSALDTPLPAEREYLQRFLPRRACRQRVYSALCDDPGGPSPMDACSGSVPKYLEAADVASVLCVSAECVATAMAAVDALNRDTFELTETFRSAYATAGRTSEEAEQRLWSVVVDGGDAVPKPSAREAEYAARFLPVRDFRAAVKAALPCKAAVFVEIPRVPPHHILELDAVLSDTVEAIKWKIHDAEGIPPDQQALLYRGKPLGKDGDTLADCGFRLGGTLRLSMLLRGD